MSAEISEGEERSKKKAKREERQQSAESIREKVRGGKKKKKEKGFQGWGKAYFRISERHPPMRPKDQKAVRSAGGLFFSVLVCRGGGAGGVREDPQKLITGHKKKRGEVAKGL